MMDHIIRTARKDDIDTLIDLCKEHAALEGYDYDPTSKKEKLSSFLFKDQPVLRCLVVETVDGIKGYATYMPEFSTWDATHYMHMDCLFLKPELRGKGVGRKLVEQILSEAKAADFVNVQWQTPIDNYDAIGFYTTLKAKQKAKTRFYLSCH